MDLIAFRKTCLGVVIALALLPLTAAADDTIYTKVDVNPVPVKTPPPDYPDAMKRQGVSGVVAVSIVIDEKGSVVSTTVAKSSQPEFETPAMEAVKKWKFKPAQKDGVPVKMKVTVPIRFNLED
ncbi:MAG: energy transducer TonB [Nibricoccus sp.]